MMRTSSDELAPEAVAAQASAAAMPTATTPPIIPTIPIIRSAVYQHIYRYVPGAPVGVFFVFYFLGSFT